ncbi:MAG: magnesium/cobalt transporter CorA [SAR324 cluster bacterium]|nr:magnesium/cobalt transporter CorA [SAR324 cluster bacterium]
MPAKLENTADKAGLSPGTLVHIGEQKTEEVQISLIEYDGSRFWESEDPSEEELKACREAPSITWIRVNGLHDLARIEKIGRIFDLHPLLMEDIVSTEQRPKVDEFEEHLFLVVKMLSYDKKQHSILQEQISLIFGKNFLISFSENKRGLFDPLKVRIQKGKGRSRKKGADYLLYMVLDLIVDKYFVLLNELENVLEATEDEMISAPTPETLQKIYELKKQVLLLNRHIQPLDSLIQDLLSDNVDWLEEETMLFYRDLDDHCTRVLGTLNHYRDMLSGMIDMNLSLVSNKTNDVMKMLAIIATIFMPLTFIAGIYGMNFEQMPELKWPWGYPMAIGLMVLVGIGMGMYIKKQKWL